MATGYLTTLGWIRMGFFEDDGGEFGKGKVEGWGGGSRNAEDGPIHSYRPHMNLGDRRTVVPNH